MIKLAYLVLACLANSALGQSPPTEACHSIVLNVTLSAGDRFEKAIGGNLVFKVEPDQLGPKGEGSGWQIELTPADAPDNDYIYPVNPPLRFNGVQTLGAAYGDDAKTSLSHPHEMSFLLKASDYDRLWPLVTDALWPYNASDPDKAGAKYFDALKAVPKGDLKVTVTAYDADPKADSIRSLKFSAKFTAPVTFVFDPGLRPEPSRCPDAD